ncbi:MAG TPA: 3-phosphoshikimate 1-carboxyvinyltransferase [Bacteroidales bacterium]|nr:3-phosphoshikimate 1-carboxyvinyltransferase [Bacteroidales bacterium]
MMLQISAQPLLKSPLSVVLPFSKSIANRMIIMRYLSGSALPLKLSESNDTHILEQLLQSIPVQQGMGIYNAEDAGTVFRFMAAVLAITPGKHVLTGTTRMLNRPIKPLVDALCSLNANINYLKKQGYPPLLIQGRKLTGYQVKLDASLSSQFGSALMMIAPGLENGLVIELLGKVVSMPYLKLTATLMHMQGQDVEIKDNIISVAPGSLSFNHPISEGDWSSASFWFGLAALVPGKEIIFENLNQDSPQGDRCLLKLFEPLGVISTWQSKHLHIIKKHSGVSHFEADFTDCPDLLPAIAVSCAGMGISASLKGISTLRLKESDRVAAICDNLNRLGFKAINNEHELKLLPVQNKTDRSKLIINAFGDHRIAMAFALLGAQNRTIIIDTPGVVEKSYPQFWQHLEQAGVFLKEIQSL